MCVSMPAAPSPPLCGCVGVSHRAGAQNEDCSWAGYIRTGVGRAVRQRQVGASSPGTCAEVLLALATVGARGVVFTLTLQAALAHGAQVGMQVALTPEETRGWEGSVSSRSGLWASGPQGLWASGEGKNSGTGLCWDARGGTLEEWSTAHSDSPSAQSPDSLSHGLETFPSQKGSGPHRLILAAV